MTMLTNNESSTKAPTSAAAAAQPKAAGGTSQRANKPRPLVLNSATTGAEDNSRTNTQPPRQPNAQTSMTMDEVLDLMQTINTSVRAGQFTPTLASQIYRLCQQMKISGECLEISHKNEMNRVFVSLRQACCRDAGTLGTPCRLKIMELVELRAMGWRPSLSHSQYYLNRHGGNNSAAPPSNVPQPPHPVYAAPNAQNHGNAINMANMMPATTHYVMAPAMVPQQQPHVINSYEQQQQAIQNSINAMMASGPAPVSAPPFGTIPINPFAMNGPPPPPGGMLQQMSIPSSDGHSPATSYYLIPASAGFMSNNMQHQWMPPASPMATSAQMHYPFQVPPNATPMNGAPHTSSTDNVSPIMDTPWPKGAVIKPSPKFPRPQKIPGKNQFRDEIVIRNADSGKIMGVKGRRVAVVEELSKTVISFQKVATGAKDRGLTITGNTEEVIEHAKILIEETIRRNVSPNRPDGEIPAIEESDNVDELYDSNDGLEENEYDDGIKMGENKLNIKFEKADDGTLRMSCDDPAVLQAAQEALNQYFTRRAPARRSHTDRKAERSERRKSVPSFSPEMLAALAVAAGQNAAKLDLEDAEGRRRTGSVHEQKLANEANAKTVSEADRNMNWRAHAAHTRSTPNLAQQQQQPVNAQPPTKIATLNDDMSGNPVVLVRAAYTRDYVLKCADSSLSRCEPTHMPHMLNVAPDITRQSNGAPFDSREYKKLQAAIQQQRA